MTRDADGLTPKQRAFVNALIADPDGNASRAYMTAYGVKDPAVARAAASRLLTHVNVAPLIGKTRQKATEIARAETDESSITLASHLSKMAELRDAAAGALEFHAAIKAETQRGKVAGLGVTAVRFRKPIEEMTLAELEEAERALAPPAMKALSA